MKRVLEPEVMDTPADAAEYDAMNHDGGNRRFAEDFLKFRHAHAAPSGAILDVGTGTAQIPVLLAELDPDARVIACDAAAAMLELATARIAGAGLTGRVAVLEARCQQLPMAGATCGAVVSNSLIHHLPEPGLALAEMLRVCRPGGAVFVRDLCRPDSPDALAHLVEVHASSDTPRQRQLFSESLLAALTLVEVRELVESFGYPGTGVTQTSDRHWTWAAYRG